MKWRIEFRYLAIALMAASTAFLALFPLWVTADRHQTRLSVVYACVTAVFIPVCLLRRSRLYDRAKWLIGPLFLLSIIAWTLCHGYIMTSNGYYWARCYRRQ